MNLLGILEELMSQFTGILNNGNQGVFSDENGFYNFLDMDIGIFTVEVDNNGENQFVEVTTMKNELICLNFLLEFHLL